MDKLLEKEEILDYIILRASGRGQSKEFSFRKFYFEMLKLVRKQKEIESKLIKNQK